MDPDRKLPFGDVVKRGLQWLIAQQDPAGCVGGRVPKYLYNHAIATIALSEAYGMTSSPVLLDPAQHALDFLVGARNPGRGWRYSERSGENDTSVTGWAVLALKSARMSELSFPTQAGADALSWIDEATSQSRVGYTRAGTGKVYIPGLSERFSDHPTMNAVAVLSRIFLERKRSDPAVASMVAADPPAWKPENVDFYYWYYGSLALFQYDGPDGSLWKKWNESMKNALVLNQKSSRSGCENGSWDPSVDRWGSEGGRVYATAINTLTLEVYYRYCILFGASPTKK